MRQITTDLWETDVESPFPGLTTHAYLFIHEDGNVLFYNTSHAHELDHMQALGGVDRQYLSHQDELGDSLLRIHQRFGARLGGHIAERAEFSRFREPDILFQTREVHPGGIEVIPTPGHSPGSTCFLVSTRDGGHYLFTGDTLYRGEGGAWKPGFIPGHSRPEDSVQIAASLRLLRGLAPDLVVSSAFAGESGVEAVDEKRWHALIDTALEALPQP